MTTPTERASHTPGPWVFAYGSVYVAANLTDENGVRIALMDRNTPKTSPCERDANARLIAAAPALLEALKPFADLLESPDEYGDEMAQLWVAVADIKAAWAALAKAKGQP